MSSRGFLFLSEGLGGGPCSCARECPRASAMAVILRVRVRNVSLGVSCRWFCVAGVGNFVAMWTRRIIRCGRFARQAWGIVEDVAGTRMMDVVFVWRGAQDACWRFRTS